MAVKDPKEYPWGSFTLWVFPEDELTLRKDGRYNLKINLKDPVARSHGQRDRRELYWRLDFIVTIPKEDQNENFLLPKDCRRPHPTR